MCYVNKKQKKREKNYKQKRCFACITLDNKVILKVRLTFHLWWFWVGSESLRIHFIFYIWCSLHRHTAITRAASLLLGILSAVFWQRWWWSSRPPCGSNFCSRVSLCANCGLRHGAAKIRPDNRLTLNKKFVKPAWMNFFLFISGGFS